MRIFNNILDKFPIKWKLQGLIIDDKYNELKWRNTVKSI